MGLILRALLFIFSLVLLAVVAVVFLVVGGVMLLLGKKPRVIKFQQGWQPMDFPRQEPKDVTPKPAGTLTPKVEELNF